MTGPSDVIDPATVRLWVRRAVDVLGRARREIDRANVFPVADADTGTNMYLTLLEGRRAVDDLHDDAGVVELLRALARGALLGARGNSGVILSEYLRGLAAAASDEPGTAVPVDREVVLGAPVVVRALRSASEAASRAVADPVPGTILTSAAAASDAAVAATSGADALQSADGVSVLVVLTAACDGALAALRRSPRELDVLARAGVLDAGAFGLVLVLDALRAAVDPAAVSEAEGTMRVMSAGARDSTTPGPLRDSLPDSRPDLAGRPELVDGEFEVMFVLEESERGAHGEPGADLAALVRDGLQQLGESVVVVGGAGGAPGTGAWQAHVHTDHPAQAIDVGRRAAVGRARLRQVCVRHLPGLAHEHGTPVAGASDHGVPTTFGEGLGVVAVTSAPGLVPDLARSGAVVLVTADGGRAPASAEVRRVVVDAGTARVVVLPGGVDVAEVARRVATDRDALGGVEVDVLDAPTDLHVVAALAGAQLAEDGHQAAMVRALAQVRAARVTPDGEAVLSVLDDLLSDAPEVLTVLPGLAVDPAVVEIVAGIARSRVPGIEVVVLSSGRDEALIELGVE
ncbi:DAK2 domain-containing protein [Oerskovia flava]|uniref:DAK2 domain-containing protein n=1 Tax=Oerskovia flava TaxID=2986422 RepID=UPI00223EDBB5|nr:DAK2 domain-containing protein [Oerskovia sp. JB1-3-2]